MEKRNAPTKTTTTDSLFGMMLVGAFVGAAFGPGAESTLKSAEVTSSVYEDRQPSFKLGQKNSLGGAFARGTQDWKEIMAPLRSFTPSPSPSFSF